MFILDACSNVSVLGTILFFKKLVHIISIIVPILLVLLISIDFAKAVMASSDDDMKRAQSLAIKRIIAGLLVFFVPLIVDTAFTTLSDKGVSGLTCYENASDEVLNPLIEADRANLELKESERKKLIEEAKKSNAAAKAYLKILQENYKNSSANSGSGSSNVTVSNQYVQAARIAEAAGGGSNCSDGHKKNCKLGDQSGKEVRFSKWRKGWTYILRPNNATVANKAALCMENAVNNNNIGYGQQGSSPWYGLWNYLNKHKELGFDPGKVTDKTSVSCCPLVAVCLKYAGYNPSKSLSCWPPATNMKKAVNASGSFTAISSRNLKDIRRGDVLISSHHMAMAV